MRHVLLSLTAVLVLGSVARANLITNGDFTSDINGWTLVTTIDPAWSGWRSEAGADGEAGYCWINDWPDPVPYIEQTVTGLAAGQTYGVSGWYKTGAYGQWDGGPSFEVKMDDTVVFFGGDTTVVQWTPFSFLYTATDSDATIRLTAQVDHDSDYEVDQISMAQVPEPATLGLLGTGCLAILLSWLALPFSGAER